VLSYHVISHLTAGCAVGAVQVPMGHTPFQISSSRQTIQQCAPLMRLVNTTTLRVEYFVDDVVPSYAILSHTWDREEITLEDMTNVSLHSRPSFKKIRESSAIAARSGYSYIWIDTCCIDKSSSAELSEAINSMFKYYQRAGICYAHLADVQAELPEVGQGSLAASRWFTRGWTLQELIAPEDIHFYSSDWHFLGSRVSLGRSISTITGIDDKILQHSIALTDISVAKRMSWAAQRNTTRAEDIAYCLLGIFNINMPLLYGEGERSFLRLQEQIVQNTADHSLFAWSPISPRPEGQSRRGIGVLACHPQEFTSCANFVPLEGYTPLYEDDEPYAMTNKGLQIRLPLIPKKGSDLFLAVLSCRKEGDFSGPLAIPVIAVPSSEGKVFVRADHYAPEVVHDGSIRDRVKSVLILKEEDRVASTPRYAWVRGLGALGRALLEDEFRVLETFSMAGSAGHVSHTIILGRPDIPIRQQRGGILFRHKTGNLFAITFGLSGEGVFHKSGRSSEPKYSCYVRFHDGPRDDSQAADFLVRLQQILLTEDPIRPKRTATMMLGRRDATITASLSWALSMGHEVLTVDFFCGPMIRGWEPVSSSLSPVFVQWRRPNFGDFALLLARAPTRLRRPVLPFAAAYSILFCLSIFMEWEEGSALTKLLFALLSAAFCYGNYEYTTYQAYLQLTFSLCILAFIYERVIYLLEESFWWFYAGPFGHPFSRVLEIVLLALHFLNMFRKSRGHPIRELHSLLRWMGPQLVGTLKTFNGVAKGPRAYLSKFTPSTALSWLLNRPASWSGRSSATHGYSKRPSSTNLYHV
jgi:hypothetical protein